MLAQLFSTAKEPAESLSDVARAEDLIRVLPRNDPLAAQKRVCQALADFCARENPDRPRLRALLTLDVQTRSLVDALLVNYLPGTQQPRAVEVRCWQSAFELARSFGAAHAHALASLRDNVLSKDSRDHLPFVLLRLFQHRQMELLLRPFVDERLSRFSWKELHDACQVAQMSGAFRETMPVIRPLESETAETTLEREYTLLLLQDLVNSAHIPPHDAFWAFQSFPQWYRRKKPVRGRQSGGHRFAANLDGDGGPVRIIPTSAGNWHYVDTSPLLAAIRGELGRRDPAGVAPSPGRGRRLRLLRKLDEILTPEPAATTRRGDRMPVAVTVEVAVSMAQILRTLRELTEEAVAAVRPPQVARVDEGFTTTGGFTEMPMKVEGRRLPDPGEFEAPYPPLTMVERSDSGCRMHGAMNPANPVIPGTLIAFREHAAGKWSVGVVRRVRKRLGGKRMEIGVEFVGSNARRIIVAPDFADESPEQAQAAKETRFAAIYLPESANYPAMPMKTVVLPSRGLVAGDRLCVRSRATIHTIVLGEPFEEQADFVWAPFEIVDRCLRDAEKRVGATQR